MKHTRLTATVLMALIVGGTGARAERFPVTITPLVRTVDLDIGETQEVELADGSKA